MELFRIPARLLILTAAIPIKHGDEKKAVKQIGRGTTTDFLVLNVIPLPI